MSEIEAFFRFCPQCGRRFHVRLVSKKLTDVQKSTYVRKRAMRVPAQQYFPPKYGLPTPVIVQESVPVTIDVEGFEFSYKCKHCGHTWNEHHLEQHEEG